MKILQTQSVKLNSTIQQNAPESNPQVAFKGAETLLIQTLRYLQTNQAWGACFVDVGCMGAPRTAVDLTRSPEAGIETARREFTSTGNHALIGIYGSVAGLLLCQAFNKLYNVKAHKMFISNEMLDITAHSWDDAQKGIRPTWKNFFNIARLWDKSKRKQEPLEKFLNDLASRIEGFSPEHKNCSEKGWVTLDAKAQKAFVARLLKEVKEGPESISKDAMNYLKAVIAESVGSESKIKLEKQIEGAAEPVKAVASLENTIGDIYKISKAFTKGEVAQAFKGPLANNEFIKGLKKLNPRIAIGGLAAAIGIGVCVQPLNAYLTKKKTGKSGFVGVEGNEGDKSRLFPILKVAVAGLFGLGMLRTIGRYKEILTKVQFKGFIPTIEQFKLIYCTTIMSRLLAARDKNELRESATKDSLGFVNWLILGGFVSTLSAAAIEKLSMFKGEKFIRYNKLENGEKWFDWLTKSSIISRDEVLFEAIKKAGKSAIKADGKAMNFKEMFEFVSKFDKMAIKKVRYLGLIQFAGYLYSGLALGVGIPKLNIAVTKHLNKKHHHHKPEENKAEENKAEKEVSKQNA